MIKSETKTTVEKSVSINVEMKMVERDGHRHYSIFVDGQDFAQFKEFGYQSYDLKGAYNDFRIFDYIKSEIDS